MDTEAFPAIDILFFVYGKSLDARVPTEPELNSIFKRGGLFDVRDSVLYLA